MTAQEWFDYIKSNRDARVRICAPYGGHLFLVSRAEFLLSLGVYKKNDHVPYVIVDRLGDVLIVQKEEIKQ